MKVYLRPVAIYLPQFHPIKENDEWWGKGFTEWRNVTKAKPLFEGHYQPHLPADLGLYDLRLPEVREQQAQMAKEHGIYGFCYYHYWFNGRRILEKPFQEVFESGKPDFPFMLCWANENWTRTWDGLDQQVLLEQNYTTEDYTNHIKSLIPYFKDSRYIKVDNKPVFAIYKPQLLQNIQEAISIWRTEAKKEGIDLYLCWFETLGTDGKDFTELGLDAAIEFPPHGALSNYSNLKSKEKTLKDEISISNIEKSIRYRFQKLLNQDDKAKGLVLDYKEFIEITKKSNKDTLFKRYKCVTPGWDNSARKSVNYVILKESTPEIFKNWTLQSLQGFKPYSTEENLFFINAWNEWAEGNHLEPCLKWQTNYLKSLKEAIEVVQNKMIAS